MKTYLVPIMHEQGVITNYLKISANDKYQAMLRGRLRFNELRFPDLYSIDENYEEYHELPCRENLICDKIKESSSILQEEIAPMSYFNFDWNLFVDILAETAAPENWSNELYPRNKILTNYMVHTYKKLLSERSVIFTTEYALFNTGLFTKFYQPIYAYQDRFGLQFLTDYDLGEIGILSRPPKANYFSDPSLLLFDWHYQINVNYQHILKDVGNLDRIPESLKNCSNILNILTGAIETMKKRVSANYRLAIPQYYEGKIQLLLPLYLNGETPDLALAVTKVGNCYQGHTCLTLDMAYNNARLIAKPEANWLSN